MTSRTASRILSSLSRRPATFLLADATTTTHTMFARSRTPVAAVQCAHHTRQNILSTAQQRRLQHTIPRFTGANPFSKPAAENEATGAAPEATTDAAPQTGAERVASQPHYQLSFTCVPCGQRSQHVVSKQGYHHGSVLITCPDCRNRHVISDHLGVFSDRKGVTVEDLMREKGLLVKKGTLGEDGNIEFWQDDLPDADGAAKA